MTHADLTASRAEALHQISWSGVFAGVILGLTAQLLLNLLGVGVGAAAIDPGAAGNPGAGSVSIVGAVWYVVAGVVGAFVGGYVASRLSGRPDKATGGFHGLTAWAVTTLLVLYLLTTSVGSLVGGALNGLGGALSSVGGAASGAAQTAAPALANAADPLGDVEKQVRDASGGSDPEALRATAASAVQAVLTGDPAKADDARARAAEALSKAQGVTLEQARTQVGEYEARYRQLADQAKAKAVDAAKATATVVSRGAILGVLALLLGAAAAWFGGVAGAASARRRTF